MVRFWRNGQFVSPLVSELISPALQAGGGPKLRVKTQAPARGDASSEFLAEKLSVYNT